MYGMVHFDNVHTGHMSLFVFVCFNPKDFLLSLIHRANEQNKEVSTSLCDCGDVHIICYLLF